MNEYMSDLYLLFDRDLLLKVIPSKKILPARQSSSVELRSASWQALQYLASADSTKLSNQGSFGDSSTFDL